MVFLGQGQTLDRVGIDLATDAFAHGQAYVDVTRVRHRNFIRVLAPPNRLINGIPHCVNIVYSELLVRPNPSTLMLQT